MSRDEDLERVLYPSIEAHRTFQIEVGDGHTLYVEEAGNPSGKVVVFLRGGPGGGCSPNCRRFFDPEKYRIVLFDQRGCGRSLPHASLEANTTWDLVSDIEKIREHLQIESWMVFGGSWGSTLALAYAESHPERVSELVLRGIFTLRREELLWFYQEGASYIFPDAYAEYISVIPEKERTDLMGAFHRRLTSSDLEEQIEAAKAWSQWEGSTVHLLPDPEWIEKFGDPHFAIAFARIECHFFMNRGFFETDDQLIQNADRLKNIPTTIVHGRYDVVCPVKNAFDLKAKMPHADLRVVANAGHSSFEPAIAKQLRAATDRYALVDS